MNHDSTANRTGHLRPARVVAASLTLAAGAALAVAAPASAATSASVRAAHETVTVSAGHNISVGADVRNVRRGDRLVIEQLYRKHWHSIKTVTEATHRRAVTHVSLGTAPTGRYTLRFVLDRHGRPIAHSADFTAVVKAPAAPPGNGTPPPPPPVTPPPSGRAGTPSVASVAADTAGAGVISSYGPPGVGCGGPANSSQYYSERGLNFLEAAPNIAVRSGGQYWAFRALLYRWLPASRTWTLDNVSTWQVGYVTAPDGNTIIVGPGNTGLPISSVAWTSHTAAYYYPIAQYYWANAASTAWVGTAYQDPASFGQYFPDGPQETSSTCFAWADFNG